MQVGMVLNNAAKKDFFYDFDPLNDFILFELMALDQHVGELPPFSQLLRSQGWSTRGLRESWTNLQQTQSPFLGPQAILKGKAVEQVTSNLLGTGCMDRRGPI